MGQARPTRFKTAKAPPSALKLPRPSRWLSSLMSNSATPSFVARWGSLDTPRTAEPPAEGLDSFDVAILEILQRENTTPLRDHRPSCESVSRQRRVKRMREDGIIVGNIAVVDPARLGRAITILVEIVVESERIDPIEAVRASLLAAPEVQQCY